MQPLVSVIIPVYNAEKYIERCLNSVVAQTYENLEIILVDDGSPDNSGKICDEYTKKYPGIRVIHQENHGVSTARNNGIDVAAGEYITFVDPDDWLEQDMYKTMMAYMKVHNLDIICIDTYQVKPNKTVFKPLFETDRVMGRVEALAEILTDGIDNAVWNKIYKRSVMANIRFPVGRRYEDVATVYKYFAAAGLVGYVRKPMYYYFLSNPASFIAGSFNPSSRYDCFLAYQERYNYALDNCDSTTIDGCQKLVIKQALSTLTAMYASGEKLDVDKYKNLKETITDAQKFAQTHKIGLKNKILLWSFFNCRLLHVVYAQLSSFAKKVKSAVNKVLTNA